MSAHSSDRMSSDPTAPRRSTTFGCGWGGPSSRLRCARRRTYSSRGAAHETSPGSCSWAPRRRAAWPPPCGRSPGSPTATARTARSSSRSRTSRRPPWSPSAASRTGVLTGETPGEAIDRLDLAKLRQLVDRVEARDARGARARAADERPRAGRLAAGPDGALARAGLAAAPRVRRGRGRAQRAAHAERRARDRARHAEPARARARRAQPRARRHQPRRHRAAGRARPAGAGAARARGGQRELPAAR